MRIRIGTRQSPLAKWQADYVAGELTKLGARIEMVPITTTGDVSSLPLGAVGGQGLFTKEIQRALLDNRCDLAVHSLKDLPTEPVPGICLAAVPKREEVGDCLIGRTAPDLATLSPGAVIGTGSLRRMAQLRYLRPDLIIADIRGNVDSRIRKLDDGNFDAIVLAAAGLRRLGLESRVTEWFSSEAMLSAIGQGALGLEARENDDEIIEFVRGLTDDSTHYAVLAERAMLRALRGGCLAPVAGLARVADGTLYLTGAVYSVDGTRRIRTDCSGSARSAGAIGIAAANQLQIGGADGLISDARRNL